MGYRWVILERKQEEHEQDGIRYKAFPLLDDYNPQTTLDIVRNDKKQKYWIVEDIKGVSQ